MAKGLIFSIVVILAAAGISLTCGREPKPAVSIQLQVDDDFRGELIVPIVHKYSENDARAPWLVKATKKGVSGKFPDGPYMWQSCRWTSGKRLIRSDEAEVQKGVLLWTEQIGNEDEKWMFVGTEAEFRQWYEKEVRGAGYVSKRPGLRREFTFSISRNRPSYLPDKRRLVQYVEVGNFKSMAIGDAVDGGAWKLVTYDKGVVGFSDGSTAKSSELTLVYDSRTQELVAIQVP